uniref:Maturation n=1 Tax=Leviviridae sp. TaxID=2027243 RepID=A0A514D6L0_9VIRU|nr:MAG: hypothetical protein H2RhizoLitter491419_000001 [Leviviridae sp.]
MAGYFTEKRDTGKFMNKVYKYGYKAPYPPYPVIKLEDSINIPLIQETTSYRSGGRYETMPIQDLQHILMLDSYNNAPQSPTDNGHPFFTSKQEIFMSQNTDVLKNGDCYYRGPIVPNGTDFMGAPPFDLGYWGPTMIARTEPTNTAISLSEALAQLISVFGGLPKIPLGKITASDLNIFELYDVLQTFRKAGSEYLNLSFGWGPFIRDLVKVLQTVSVAHALITNFVENDGLPVYRRRSSGPIVDIYTIDSDVDFNMRTGMRGLSTSELNPIWDNHNRSGKRTRTYRNTRTIKFDAEYRYFLPTGKTDLDKIEWIHRVLNKGISIDITPDVLWNLLPWSWLLDYFANIGDVIHNVSQFGSDSLMLGYAYIQVHDVTDVTHTYRSRDSNSNRDIDVSITYRTTVKRRYKASPYGFGLTPGDLTPQQNAILASLAAIALGRPYWKR